MLPLEDLRSMLGHIFINEKYTVMSLAKDIGISYKSLILFLRHDSSPRLKNELKIKRFVMKYRLLQAKKS
jgi:hypothetical protein